MDPISRPRSAGLTGCDEPDAKACGAQRSQDESPSLGRDHHRDTGTSKRLGEAWTQRSQCIGIPEDGRERGAPSTMRKASSISDCMPKEHSRELDLMTHEKEVLITPPAA